MTSVQTSGDPASTGPRARPSPERLQAAYGAVVPDLVAPDLAVLLCGINPSLWSGAVGLHFASAGNRLWPVLHGSGWTPRRLRPAETDEVLRAGIGITNLVARATARADELDDAELRAGLPRLAATAERWAPRWVAFLGCRPTGPRPASGRPRSARRSAGWARPGSGCCPTPAG